jgi:hypothetical protein
LIWKKNPTVIATSHLKDKSFSRVRVWAIFAWGEETFDDSCQVLGVEKHLANN